MTQIAPTYNAQFLGVQTTTASLTLGAVGPNLGRSGCRCWSIRADRILRILPQQHWQILTDWHQYSVSEFSDQNSLSFLKKNYFGYFGLKRNTVIFELKNIRKFFMGSTLGSRGTRSVAGSRPVNMENHGKTTGQNGTTWGRKTGKCVWSWWKSHVQNDHFRLEKWGDDDQLWIKVEESDSSGSEEPLVSPSVVK